MSNVQFHFIKKLDYSLIIDTWEKVYNKKFNIDYWKWRFENNPYDKRIYVGYIVENDILASYYAVSPTKIIINNKTYKAALMNMAMTHPNYQGKGHYINIELALHKQLKDDGFVCVYGFANHNAHRIHKKHAGWIDLAILNQFICKRENYKARHIKNSDKFCFDKGCVNNKILNQAIKLQYSNKKIKLLRDYDFLKWRLILNPINKYCYLKIFQNNKLSGVIFYKHFSNEIDILEYFYLDIGSRYDSLINGINFLFNLSDQVNIWSNLFSREHLLLEEFGFIECKFDTYFGTIPFSDKVFINDYSEWHYRFLDSDVF